MSQPALLSVHPRGSDDEPLRVCVLDSEKPLVEILQRLLEGLNFLATGTSDPQQALERIASGKCRVVLCDIKTPAVNGQSFLERALRVDPGAYVILMADQYTAESAIDAIQRGAYDYLSKSVDGARLKQALGELADEFQRRRRIVELEGQLLRDLEFDGIVGRSPIMIELFERMQKVARHYSNLLLTGEPGTGKKLTARVVYSLSPAAEQKFAACDCSVSLEPVLDRQLFGHIQAAASGGFEVWPGLFEYASGGTIFLNEVSDASLAIQDKLLRAIEEGEILRVGSVEVRRVTVRLIAATSRDLRAEVAAGRLRKDLFARLSAVQPPLPTLTERWQDIPLLVAFF